MPNESLSQDAIDAMFSGGGEQAVAAVSNKKEVLLKCRYCGKTLSASNDNAEKHPITIILSPGCQENELGHMYISKEHKPKYEWKRDK